MAFRIKTKSEYNAAYQNSIDKPELFWEEIASNYEWKKPWDKVLEWDFKKADVKWFINAKLNITENCIDRHLKEHGEKVALLWEPNNPSDPIKKYTYKELHSEVCKFSNVLKMQGIKKGDRVCLYMPMIPELCFAVLACARIGAIHSVVFAGFSATSLADRINDASAKAVITSDGMNRGSKKMNVKNIVDNALENCTSVEKVIVINHLNETINMQNGRDVWYHEATQSIDDNCQAEVMDAEDILFILYTSGSTGKPKGVVHTCAGYMVFVGYSFTNVFQYENNDIYWCTADIGWVTGHSYIIYGPLLAGATTMMFEGIPTWPDAGRFWEIVDKHKVNQFYTAPTAIRSLMASGLDFVKSHKLTSLKVLGTVGEPINVEAWEWYNKHIGKEKCPIVDTWWQTETGGIMITALAGISELKPSFAGQPMPGVQLALLDEDGKEIEGDDVEGYLCIKYPWPSIIRTTYGDHERCKNVYFSHYKGYYFTGDGARREKNNMYRIIGRVDDVINVSGHRFGTAEIENAIDEHGVVIESAVVGYPHEIKGQGIYAFVICEKVPSDATELRKEILNTVSEHIGKIAKPDKIQFVSGLPKTRSGKIMRRILRKVAEGNTSNLGDTTTLLDPSIVEELKEGAV